MTDKCIACQRDNVGLVVYPKFKVCQTCESYGAAKVMKDLCRIRGMRQRRKSLSGVASLTLLMLDNYLLNALNSYKELLRQIGNRSETEDERRKRESTG